MSRDPSDIPINEFRPIDMRSRRTVGNRLPDVTMNVRDTGEFVPVDTTGRRSADRGHPYPEGPAGLIMHVRDIGRDTVGLIADRVIEGLANTPDSTRRMREGPADAEGRTALPALSDFRALPDPPFERWQVTAHMAIRAFWAVCFVFVGLRCWFAYKRLSRPTPEASPEAVPESKRADFLDFVGGAAGFAFLLGCRQSVERLLLTDASVQILAALADAPVVVVNYAGDRARRCAAGRRLLAEGMYRNAIFVEVPIEVYAGDRVDSTSPLPAKARDAPASNAERARAHSFAHRRASELLPASARWMFVVDDDAAPTRGFVRRFCRILSSFPEDEFQAGPLGPRFSMTLGGDSRPLPPRRTDVDALSAILWCKWWYGSRKTINDTVVYYLGGSSRLLSVSADDPPCMTAHRPAANAPVAYFAERTRVASTASVALAATGEDAVDTSALFPSSQCLAVHPALFCPEG